MPRLRGMPFSPPFINIKFNLERKNTMKKVILLLSLFIFINQACSQWREINLPISYPQYTIGISNVALPSADIAYLASSRNYTSGYTDQTKFYKTTNKGINWTQIYEVQDNPVQTECDLDVYFVNINTGYYARAVHSSRPYTIKIYKTTNGGINWSIKEINNITHAIETEDHPAKKIRVLFKNENIGYIAEWTNLYKTTNGGDTWTKIFTTYNHYYHICDLALSTVENVLFIGGYAGYSSPVMYPFLYKDINDESEIQLILDGEQSHELGGITSMTFSRLENYRLFLGGTRALGYYVNNEVLLNHVNPITVTDIENFGSFTDGGIFYLNNNDKLLYSSDGGENWTEEVVTSGLKQ